MATPKKASRSERALQIPSEDVTIHGDGTATIKGYTVTESNCECNDYRFGQNRCVHILRFETELKS